MARRPCYPIGFGYSSDEDDDDGGWDEPPNNAEPPQQQQPQQRQEEVNNNAGDWSSSTNCSSSSSDYDDDESDDWDGAAAAPSSNVNANRQMAEQIESLVHRNLQAERDLIQMDPLPIESIIDVPTCSTSAPLLVNGLHNNNTSSSSLLNTSTGSGGFAASQPNLLPRKSICYDYICHPLAIKEWKREFYPLVGELSHPFLRPIVIDGIGLIKAYWEGESDEEVNRMDFFPMLPLVRCLFYWISRGHRAQICFPVDFSPISQKEEFFTTDQDLRDLKQLEKLGMAKFFECSPPYDGSPHPQSAYGTSSPRSPIKWFEREIESMRACLITSFAHYLGGMRSNLSMNYEYMRWDDVQMCPDRTLQPNFGSRADLVFFSSYGGGGARKEFMVDTVLDVDIKSEEEYSRYEPFQLSFIDQAKQLQTLYNLLPEGRRIREAPVMVAVLERLRHFL